VLPAGAQPGAGLYSITGLSTSITLLLLTMLAG
jgi:hypothetical protein